MTVLEGARIAETPRRVGLLVVTVPADCRILSTDSVSR